VDRHLQPHIKALFEQYDRATLATCGAAGPQVSVVTYQTLRPHTCTCCYRISSDHLFNLDGQPDLVLLTPTWKLHGRGSRTQKPPLLAWWQAFITVEPLHLHILDKDGQYAVETIDF
jgi:hypothetical protein